MNDFPSIVWQLIQSLGQLCRRGKRRSNDPEKWIEEFQHLSGRGHSHGWHFNRYEVHQR